MKKKLNQEKTESAINHGNHEQANTKFSRSG